MKVSRLVSAAFIALAAYISAPAQNYTITTFAGGGLPINIPGTSAQLMPGPEDLADVAVDAKGNVFFPYQNTVLRLSATTGLLSRLAGTGTPGFSGDNGPAIDAQLNLPSAVAVDTAGNLYIADWGNRLVRRVSNGVITTVAGGGNGGPAYNGPATSATLLSPSRLAVDPGGALYITDDEAFVISRVSNGMMTTFAGNGREGYGGDNGPATSAPLIPEGIAFDSAGNLYIADTGNCRVREVSNGIITTIAGVGCSLRPGDDGAATTVFLYYPVGIALDASGNVYIAQGNFNRVAEISGGILTTFAGTADGVSGFGGDNGPAVAALLNDPVAVAVDPAGNVLIADQGNQRIRSVSNGVIASVAGDGLQQYGDNGPATTAQLDLPSGVALDSSGDLYIADTSNNRIRKVSNGIITTVAGNGVEGYSGDNGPATSAGLADPTGVAIDAAGNLYISDTPNERIRMVSSGVITTFAGLGQEFWGAPGSYGGDNGPAINAQLNVPHGLAVDASGSLYIADTGNDRIRKVANGIITTVAGGGLPDAIGDNGPATSAFINGPQSVAVDASGNLYIADTGGGRIRKVTNGVITTVAGGGTGGDGPAASAMLKNPVGVAMDAAGSLYITQSNNTVRKVTNGVISTIAGGGSSFGDSGPATSAQLDNPTQVVIDPAGNVYVADANDARVRVLTPHATPSINQGGVVPNDSTVPVIQAGEWVSIFGTNLAPSTSLWNADFPTSLGGVSVNIDNKPAYLWFVSPNQINLQVPDDSATGQVSVAVTTPSGTSTSTVTLAPYAPSFSLLGDGIHVAGEIATTPGTYDLVGPANTFSFATRPVKPGETLTLYGVGFGPTTPHVPAGQLFSSSAPTVSPVTITIGGINANVLYSGITEAGLYQFNLTVPQNAASGDQPLQATVNGVQTPPGPVVTVQ